MKRNAKRLFLALFGMLCALTLILAGACGGGKKAPLHLDAGKGGTLAETDFSVKVGTDLNKFLEGKAPEPLEGLTFAGWFNGDYKIASDATMPEGGMSLTAKYDVSYTVNLYISDNFGVYGEPQTTTGTARFGEPFTPQIPKPAEHFELDPEKQNILSTTSLGPDTVFNIWYRREPIVVAYRVNAPEGVEIGGTVPSATLEYGSTLTLPACGFTPPANYRFAGWSLTDGDEERYFAGDTIENVTESFSLFANWQRGYTDLFGGQDVIFPGIDDENALTLVRGGKTFEGTLSKDGSFTFAAGENALEGKLGENFTFSYFRIEQRGEYLLYDAHLGALAQPDAGTKLTLDGLGGAQFTYHDSEGKEAVLSGSYLPIGKTDLSLELENGQTRKFVLGTRDGVPVFSFYDGAEGTYLEAVAYSVGGVAPGENYLTFDGLGVATLTDRAAYETYYGLYAIEKAGLTGEMLLLAQFETIGEVRFFTLTADGTKLYLKGDGYAGEYTEKDGSATLKLDGFAVLAESAILTREGKETAGSYWLRSSERFGVIADLYEDKAGVLTHTASYLLHEDKTFELFEEEVEEYMRLVLSAGSPTPQYPLLILYGEAYAGEAPEGALKADIYDMGASDALEYIASGYYTTKDLGGGILYYTLVVTGSGAQEGLWQSVQFLTGVVGTSDGGYLDVYYTFYIDGEPTFTRAQAAEGEGELWISQVGVSGMGGLYFAEDGSVYEGDFELVNVADGVEGAQYYVFSSYVQDAGAAAGYTVTEFYFYTLERAGATYFTKLDEMPSETANIFYYIDKYGEQADQDGGLLVFLGEGRAMYIKGGAESDMYFGSYADTGRTTQWGNKIFTFTPGDQEGGGFVPDPIRPFDFIYTVESGAGYGYFRIFDETLCGTISSKNGASLALDGFYFRASYTDSLRITHEGEYVMYDDTTLWFRDGETGELFRFPLTEDGFEDVDEEKEFSFAERYSIEDDSGLAVKGFVGYTLSLRTDGTLMLYNASGVEAGTDGTWQKSAEAENIFEIGILLRSGERLQWTVRLTDGRCTVFNGDLAGVYTGEDLAVLELDGWGGGTYFDRYGMLSSVHTVRVSEKYLAVAEAGGAWEFFAELDAAHKTFQRIQNSAAYTAFYSKDLVHSVVFKDALYVDGKMIGYYLVNAEGNRATVYVKGDNAYGTMELPFPAQDDKTYTYAQETYYRYAGGELAFEGQLTFAEREPVSVTLTLTPAGVELFPAAVTIAYAEKTFGGFTLAAVNGTLLLYDARGGEYGVTLAWDPDGGENSAAIEGEFIYYRALYDADAVSSNMVYYGYFGVGELKIGGDLWYFDFEDATDTAGDPLRFITVKAPWEMDTFGSSNAHGACYGFEITGKDGELYFARYFLVDADYNVWKQSSSDPYMLIYSIDLCRTLTFTDGGTQYTLEIEQCFYNNSFRDSFSVGEIFGATLYVNGAEVQGQFAEGSGNTLTWKTSEGTYSAELSLEDGFAAAFTLTFTLTFTLAA